VIFSVENGVRVMKGLITLLPTPGKNRVSAEEGIGRIFHVLSVSSDIDTQSLTKT
jgi:hypothetical protein